MTINMTIERIAAPREPTPECHIGSLERRTASSWERTLTEHRCTEIQLRKTLAGQEALLRHKDELIQQLRDLTLESDHRMLNSLQLIQSLLRLQSRASANAETASELTLAANRVAMIGRVHQRLHCLEGRQTVAFTQFLEDLCRDLSTMMSSGNRPKHVTVVKGIDVELPTTIGTALGYIVNELITNAAKHGKGRITVSLEPNPERGYALSVYNDGPDLPEEFDPTACKGLGIKIVRSLVKIINGELRIDRGDQNQGTRFTVLFC